MLIHPLYIELRAETTCPGVVLTKSEVCKNQEGLSCIAR